MRRPPDDAIEAAWYTPEQFVEMARRERHSAEVRAMVRRRELFEARVAEADEPLSKEQMRALWDAADSEVKGLLGPIPRERRRVALRNYHDKAGRIVHEGSIWDANDDFVKANPEMFGPQAA